MGIRSFAGAVAVGGGGREGGAENSRDRNSDLIKVSVPNVGWAPTNPGAVSSMEIVCLCRIPGSVLCREAKSITLTGTRMYVKTNEGGEECYWTPHVGGHAWVLHERLRDAALPQLPQERQRRRGGGGRGAREQYLIHGSGEDKGFATLGPGTIHQRAYVYWVHRLKRGAGNDAISSLAAPVGTFLA